MEITYFTVIQKNLWKIKYFWQILQRYTQKIASQLRRMVKKVNNANNFYFIIYLTYHNIKSSQCQLLAAFENTLTPFSRDACI